MNELELKLQAPFPADEIEWRIGRSGKKNDGSIWATALAYVSNRAIQNRLDDIFGCLSWKNQYKEWHTDSQICGISIQFGAGEWITKWDGADNTNFEGTKGGLSDSMKRAAVQWGIGRYLYNLEETFVEVSKDKPKDKTNWNYQSENDKKGIPAFYWKTPNLPDWALPKDAKKPAETKADSKNNNKSDITAGEALNKAVQRNYTEEVNAINNIDELKSYWSFLTPKEQKVYKNLVNNRKSELEAK